MMSRRQAGQVCYLGDESTFIGAAQRAQRHDRTPACPG